MLSSRHVRYKTTRIPKEKKTHQLYGEFEDRGKYYTCWNCGYRCNMDRDELDVGESMSTLSLETVTVPDETAGGIVPIPATTTFIMPVVTGGCPHCGTRNWK